MDFESGMYLIIFFVFLLFIKSMKIVPEGYEWVVEDFGKRREKTLKPGLNFIIPLFTRIKAKISMKEQTLFLPPVTTSTKDGIEIKVDLISFFHIKNPIKAVYEVKDYKQANINALYMALRKICDEMELIEILSSRETINIELRNLVKTQIEAFGCSINRIEIKDINYPEDFRNIVQEKMKLEIQNKKQNIKQLENKIVYEEKVSNTSGAFALKNKEWCENLIKQWRFGAIEKIMTLFSDTVEYYQDTDSRLYSKDEIREHWESILKDSIYSLEYKIISQEDDKMMVNFSQRGMRDINRIFEIKVDNEGECRYFKIRE